MPSLSVKNVPEETLARLRERAKRNHRSLQGELLTILDEVLGRGRLTIDEFIERAKKSGLKTPDESTAIIRHDRDSRSGC